MARLLEWTSNKALAFQAAGTLSLPVAPFFVEPAWWLAVLPLFWLQNLMTTVALHRLFVHAAFECHRAWHYTMGFLSCLAMTSSPLQWAVAHHTHHKHSDTEKDPHNNPKAKLFGVAFFGQDEYDFTKARKLMRDPLHLLLHRNYLLINALWAGAWCALGGWSAVYCAWVVPAILSMWVGAHHTRTAHVGGEPINMKPLFGILYLGEHLHRNHHKKPRLVNYATEPGQYDAGYQFIRMICHAN